MTNVTVPGDIPEPPPPDSSKPGEHSDRPDRRLDPYVVIIAAIFGAVFGGTGGLIAVAVAWPEVSDLAQWGLWAIGSSAGAAVGAITVIVRWRR